MEALKKTQRELLERIAGLSAEEAKEYLLKNIETDRQDENIDFWFITRAYKTIEESFSSLKSV